MALLKKPSSIVYWFGDSLYLNITNRCSNDCFFCFKKYKDGLGDFNLKLRDDPPTERVVTEIQEIINRKGWKEVVFCGFGEPLERLDCILQVTRWIKTHHRIAHSDRYKRSWLLAEQGKSCNQRTETGWRG